MRPLTVGAVAVTMLIAAGAPHANAQAVSCKEQMAQFEPKMNSMTDQTKKASAMKEMQMAKDMAAKNDEKGCTTHVSNAMDMMK